MILRSIEAESFGRFSGSTFEFRRGMNLVAGPNEAGKSTLAEVVAAVLFGSRQVERFKPWGRGGCSARLVFEGEGRTVDIWRNLLNDEVRLIERDDLYQTLSNFEGRVPPRGRSAVCREYRGLLEQLLGVADEDLFRATCFFGQQLAEWTGDDLGRKLRALVGGGEDADFSNILDSLLDEHFQLTRENPWGRDKQRDRELERLQKQTEQAEPLVSTTFALDSSGEVAERETQIQRLEAEIEHDRAEYVKGVCYIDRLRENLPAEEVDAEEGSVDQGSGEKTVTEVKTSELTPPSATNNDFRSRLEVAGLPENPPQNLFELLSEAAAIRQDLAEIQHPLTQLTQEEGKVKPVPWLQVGFACLLLSAGAVAGFLLTPYPWTALAGGVGFAGCCGWGWQSSRRRRELLVDLKQRRNKLEQVRAAALDRQTLLTERCEVAGLPSSAIDLVRLQKAAEAHRDLLGSYWASSGEAPVAAAVESPVATAPADKAPPEEPSIQTVEPGATAGELAELEQRLVEFAAQLKEKERELAQLKQAVEPSPESPPRVAETDKPSSLQVQIQSVQARINVIRTAVDLLVDGVEDFRQSHLQSLTDEAGRLFGRMTQGRYTQIRLDDEMRPEVQIGERRWQPADRLSRGTLDALYLALRIALSKVRCDNRALPLLLDDPFVHMDRDRLTSVMGLLDMAASDGQLIVLSHSDHLAKRAARERWHLVSLGEDVAGAVERDEEHAGQLHLL